MKKLAIIALTATCGAFGEQETKDSASPACTIKEAINILSLVKGYPDISEQQETSIFAADIICGELKIKKLRAHVFDATETEACDLCKNFNELLDKSKQN